MPLRSTGLVGATLFGIGVRGLQVGSPGGTVQLVGQATSVSAVVGMSWHGLSFGLSPVTKRACHR
jgi:hypothetical protein